MNVYATLARFIRDSTAAGRALLTAATAGDQRTALGLGTAAQSASSDFAAAVHTHDDRYFTETEINSLLTSYLTVSTAGTTYQPLDSDLTAIAALTTTTFGRSLLTQADAAAARSTLGAGTSSFDGAYSSLSGVPSTFTPSAHNQAWSTITSTPTTLSGYGITDALTTSTAASTYLALAGGTLTGPVTGTGGLVEIRNGTTAQCFDVSGTWTSSTNFESLRFKATGTAFQIGAAVGSASGTVEPVQIGQWNAAGTFTSVFRVATNGLAYIDTRIGDWVNFGIAYTFRAGGGNEVSCGSNIPLNWSSSTDARGTKDTGIGRNAAGVVEINNGTLGALRDLTCRSGSFSASVTALSVATSTIINTGTVTLPTSTTTLIGRDTTDTVTNKRIQRRIVVATTATALTPDISAADFYEYTALASALTINNPTGTPVNGELLNFRLQDNGTGRALTWGAQFRSMTATLPTTTVANKTHRVLCEWNSGDSTWDCLAVSAQP